MYDRVRSTIEDTIILLSDLCPIPLSKLAVQYALQLGKNKIIRQSSIIKYMNKR